MEALQEKIVVVIGGSSGIGLEVARQAMRAGARLVLTGRDAARLEAARIGLGEGTRASILDAHDEAALHDFFATVEAFDHLVSMVGDSMAGGFLEASPDTMRHVMHSKFWTNWMIARHSAPRLRPGGSLTFTSGTGGRAQDISASYVANLAIAAMVTGLASELAPRARVNAVAPTFMGATTSFWRGVARDDLSKVEAAFIAGVPLRRLGTVQEVASAYLHMMTNGFVTGQVLAVDGGVMLRK